MTPSPPASQVKSTGAPPRQRSLHVGICLHDALYIFGGYDGSNRVNDFYKFDFKRGKWSAIQTSIAPSARDRHVVVCHKNSIYIFGGYDGNIGFLVQRQGIFGEPFRGPNIGLGRMTSSSSEAIRIRCQAVNWPQIVCEDRLSGLMWSVKLSGLAAVTTHLIRSPAKRKIAHRGDPRLPPRKRPAKQPQCATRHRVNDFWQFDTDVNQWSQVHGDGSPPTPRHSHAGIEYNFVLRNFGIRCLSIFPAIWICHMGDSSR